MQRAGQSEDKARGWLVNFPRAVPLAIFALVVSMTAMSVVMIEQGDHRRSRAKLQENAQAIASALERRGNTSAAYLRAGAALFATVDDVPAPLFQRFVDELKVDTEFRGAEGVGWAVAVKPKELAAYEQKFQSALGTDEGVFPKSAKPQQWIVPVTFLQPDTGRNRRAIGYDMYSEPVRRAAMVAATLEGRPTASGRIVLVQEGDNSAPGFLIYMPVFGAGGTSRDLKGFIYSPFNAQQFLDSALLLESRGLNGIRLYDGRIARENLLAEAPPAMNTGDTIVEPVMIANRSMLLEIESARGNSLSDLSMATLIFGLLVASLLMIVARLLTKQAIEDRATLNWLREQNSIRDTLTRELNHRVKNTLANVLSIIALTRRRAQSLDEFAEGIGGRIRALSATHDLLTNSEWGTTPICEVVKVELAPYTQDHEATVTVEGPAVELAPNDALSLGLALHELATNAAKYGALSATEGRVSVNWTLENGHARLTWQEFGGPGVPHERKRGFGTDLIEKIVAHELRNPVELDFAPDGVRCIITVPVRPCRDFAMRSKTKS